MSNQPMRRLTSSLPAYLQIGSSWMQVFFTYRVAFFFDIVGMLLKIYLLKVVWTAVYAGRTSVDGIPLDQVISFVTLTTLQLMLFNPMLSWHLHQSVREGSIAMELARPVPFLGQLLAHQAGFSAGQIPFLLLATPFAFVLGGILPPASWSAALWYLLSLALGYIISTLIGMLIGLIAFWTFQTEGIEAIYGFLSSFFAGALVPLWFFPGWLTAIGNWLPFAAQAFIPLQIYAGLVRGEALIWAFANQLLWIFLLSTLAWGLWRKAIYKLVIQGG
jgi:ABC-2 type transport system permease protein